jgi:hypothetical protein
MRKVLLVLLGLVAVAYAAKWALRQSAPPPPSIEESSAAKTRLDDVREKRRQIEADQEQRLREALQKADPK